MVKGSATNKYILPFSDTVAIGHNIHTLTYNSTRATSILNMKRDRAAAVRCIKAFHCKYQK